MKHRLLRFLTALSLLLCIAALVLWVRSYFTSDFTEWQRADDIGSAHYHWFRIIASGRGLLQFAQDAEVSELASISAAEAATTPLGRWQLTVRESVSASNLSSPFRTPGPAFGGPANLRFGFHIAWTRSPATVRREVIVPYWAIVLITAALPALRLPVLARRLKRRGAGLCPRCGYDLRATPGRCPECGTETKAPA